MTIDIFIPRAYNWYMTNKCCHKKCKEQKELQAIKNDFDALNDVNRLRILCLLKDSKEICVCKIYEALKLPQNLVSYHLGKLKEAGFVKAKKYGVKVMYRPGKAKIKNFQFLINNLFNK
jgi:ArsR family transcriptional regulator, arsenate/arsenite/antimonite-responsive transcriptional repressor